MVGDHRSSPADRLLDSSLRNRIHPPVLGWELAYLPVESLVRDHQAEYYEALGAADRLAEATPFVEFMLTIIRETLDATPASDQAGDHHPTSR